MSRSLSVAAFWAGAACIGAVLAFGVVAPAESRALTVLGSCVLAAIGLAGTYGAWREATS